MVIISAPAAAFASAIKHLQLAAEAREEASRVVERGRQSLDGWLVEAREGLGANAEQLARSAAARVLGRELS